MEGKMERHIPKDAGLHDRRRVAFAHAIDDAATKLEWDLQLIRREIVPCPSKKTLKALINELEQATEGNNGKNSRP